MLRRPATFLFVLVLLLAGVRLLQSWRSNAAHAQTPTIGATPPGAIASPVTSPPPRLALTPSVAVGRVSPKLAQRVEQVKREEAAKQQTPEDTSKDAAEDEPSTSDETPDNKSDDKTESDEKTGEKKEDVPKIKITPEMLRLKNKIGRTLAIYERRHLNTRDHTPWDIMHSLIGFGCDTNVRRGGPNGAKVNAIGWLCWNGSCNGKRLLYLDGKGIGAHQGYQVQGHYGQFIAMLAQSRVPVDYMLKTNGKEFTIKDLVEHEKQGCQPRSELTFKLIGLMHYSKSDVQWTNAYGKWNIERLIKEEIEQPIQGETCGGTHRLFSLAYAVNKRRKRGEPITGQYKRAAKYLDQYHRYTFSLQNPDGSFSTAFFRYRENRSDINQKIRTTGHILEWLAFSVPDEELTAQHMVKAVDYLSGIMLREPNRKWQIGPLGHATHALVMYYDRVFKDRTTGPVADPKKDLVTPKSKDKQPKTDGTKEDDSSSDELASEDEIRTARLPEPPEPDAEPEMYGPALNQP
jgi:hypothetical protein